MRFLDAILCMALAWKIHDADDAVRKACRNCLAKMQDKNDRKIINSIINSRRPTIHIAVMLRELPDYILKMGWDDKPPLPLKAAKLPIISTDPGASISSLSPLAAFMKR